jgi:hypothetical protein
VAVAWEAKEAAGELYGHQDQTVALEGVDALVDDLTDSERLPRIRSVARTLKHWRLPITKRCAITSFSITDERTREHLTPPI